MEGILISLSGTIIAIGLLIYLSYKGYSVLFVAPLAGLIILLTGGLTMKSGLDLFSAGFGDVGKKILFQYLGCMVFGQCMVDNKCAHSIAYWASDRINVKYTPIFLFLVTGVLAVGGVGVGCHLIVGPIGTICLAKAGYSRNILLGSICAGMWTFAMMGPMMPTSLNGVAQSFLGTPSTAGLIPGLAGMIFILIFDAVYLQWQAVHWKKKGIVFEDFDMVDEDTEDFRKTLPSPLTGIIPIIAVLVAYNIVKLEVARALFCGAIVATAIGWKRRSPGEWFRTWESGAKRAITIISGMAILGGIGGVVSVTPFFMALLDWLKNTRIHPYIICAFGGNILAGILGSGTSAISTGVPLMLPLMENYVMTRGCDMGNMHRLLVSAAIGLDSLPHNSGIIAGNEIHHTTHKKSYFPIFITCTVCTILATFLVVLPLAMLGFK